MIEFLHELSQENRLAEAEGEAAQARAMTDAFDLKIDEMERRIEALTLTSEALWEICRTHFGITETELLKKIQEIDLRDGKADGKAQPVKGICPKCRRTINTERRRCVYCGVQLLGGVVFRKTH